MRREVLDKGYVELVDFWGGDDGVISAARFCYDSGGTREADERLIRHLLKSGHGSPFEFAGLVLEVKCPIFVRDQIVRHRMASYAVRSLRRTVAEEEGNGIFLSGAHGCYYVS